MTNKSLLRIATRKSPLALWQANYVKAALEKNHPDLHIELVGVVTTGDKILDVSLAKVGGKGLFIKELEKAIAAGEADIAVHSIKDMPAVLPEEFVLAAICEREDPRDAFVSNYYNNLHALPEGATVGTASARRGCQIKALRPDIHIETLRGNVGTRLQKLDDNKFHAIILAAAGLKRLQEEHRIREYLEPEQMLPAIGQGAVGIESLASNQQVQAWLAALEHIPTRQCIQAERAMNYHLMGGCSLPIAGYAVLCNNQLYLRGLVGKTDGSLIVQAEGFAALDKAEDLGKHVAEELRKQGADELIMARD